MFIGERDGVRIGADEVGDLTGTLPHEILCGIAEGMPAPSWGHACCATVRSVSRPVRIAVAQYEPHVGELEHNRSQAVLWATSAAAPGRRPHRPSRARLQRVRVRGRGGGAAQRRGPGRRTDRPRACARCARRTAVTSWPGSASATATAGTTARCWSVRPGAWPPIGSCTCTTTSRPGSSRATTCRSSTSHSGGSA